jgi:hypothetical protein
MIKELAVNQVYKGGLYQNSPINATEIPQLAYACDRTLLILMRLSAKIRTIQIAA